MCLSSLCPRADRLSAVLNMPILHVRERSWMSSRIGNQMLAQIYHIPYVFTVYWPELVAWPHLTSVQARKRLEEEGQEYVLICISDNYRKR